MPDQPAVLRFATIRDELDKLQIALTNLLDRDFPRDLQSVPGLQPFLLVAIKAATNTYYREQEKDDTRTRFSV